MEMIASSHMGFVNGARPPCWWSLPNGCDQMKGQNTMLRLWLAGYAAIAGMVLGLHTCAPALPLTLDEGEDFTDTGVGCVDDCLDPMED